MEESKGEDSSRGQEQRRQQKKNSVMIYEFGQRLGLRKVRAFSSQEAGLYFVTCVRVRMCASDGE